MGVTLQAWLSALQAMLPPGRAFTRHPDAMLTKLLTAFASMFLAAQLKFDALMREADPRRATTMLPDWERTLGLPDRCTPAGQQLVDRQRAAFQRLTEEGGQSAPYFIDLAEKLGEPDVTITRFSQFTCNSSCNDALYSLGDKFTWRVNIPRAALNVRPMDCNSDCNSALQDYTPSVIECAINERKPAESDVIFAYAA
jgi:uncharacterized protein YmfQ (DUF2313 family)